MKVLIVALPNNIAAIGLGNYTEYIDFLDRFKWVCKLYH